MKYPQVFPALIRSAGFAELRRERQSELVEIVNGLITDAVQEDRALWSRGEPVKPSPMVGLHKESKPCPECGATMLYDGGEPWDGPTWGCTGCGHSEDVQRPAA